MENWTSDRGEGGEITSRYYQTIVHNCQGNEGFKATNLLDFEVINTIN